MDITEKNHVENKGFRRHSSYYRYQYKRPLKKFEHKWIVIKIKIYLRFG